MRMNSLPCFQICPCWSFSAMALGKSASPNGNSERRLRRLFFLTSGLLAGHGRFFLCGGGIGFGLFLAGLFLVRFWGSIAHNFLSSFLPRLTGPRNKSFPEGVITIRAAAMIVNDAPECGTGERKHAKDRPRGILLSERREFSGSESTGCTGCEWLAYGLISCTKHQTPESC